MNATELLWKFKASLLLLFLILLSYVLLSKGAFFIPLESLLAVSFNAQMPLNIFFYEFIHTGVFHLSANLLSLLFFALILEAALSSLDVVLVFLFSGTLAAIVFSSLNPATAMIGASAGISGLFGAAFSLKPLKTLIATAAALALLYFAVAPALSFAIGEFEANSTQKISALELDLNRAREQGDLNKAAVISKKLTESKKEIEKFGEGKEFEIKTSTDFFVHGYAAAFGFLYVFLFRRKKFSEAMKGIREKRIAVQGKIFGKK
ncbi:MAG: rhomboid family intramembrane serine protease [Candidatus Diapherotrites archaeon]